MFWNILAIIAVLAAGAGLVYSIRKQQKNNRCDGCSLKESCRRNAKECSLR